MSSDIIHRGDHSDDVRQVQQLLIKAGYAGLLVDGSFGPATDEAVRDFQGKHGLAVDGRVGKMTMAALEEASAGAEAADAPAVDDATATTATAEAPADADASTTAAPADAPASADACPDADANAPNATNGDAPADADAPPTGEADQPDPAAAQPPQAVAPADTPAPHAVTGGDILEGILGVAVLGAMVVLEDDDN